MRTSHNLLVIRKSITCLKLEWSQQNVPLQAKDRRFCNAGVEFDLATLRPTYRLMWQSVGASNALAVAEGLGFDPLVIKEARQVPPPRCDASPVGLY